MLFLVRGFFAVDGKVTQIIQMAKIDGTPLCIL